MIGGAPIEIVSDLVRVGSLITATALVDRALQLVTVLASAAIDGADGVSVSLERHDRISTVAWSNDTVLEMDRHQYQTGEGPCLDAATTGDWFHIESLAAEDRWPAFVPRAREEGIASILSTPLTTPARSVGALNIYSNSEGAFGKAELDLAGLFAAQASGIVNANLTDQHAGARLAEALVDREVIAQAQGVLMGRHRMSADDAAAELFSAARDAELTVSRHAANVIASTAPVTGTDVEASHE
jgi:GAF domain-containing protein